MHRVAFQRQSHRPFPDLLLRYPLNLLHRLLVVTRSIITVAILAVVGTDFTPPFALF